MDGNVKRFNSVTDEDLRSRTVLHYHPFKLLCDCSTNACMCACGWIEVVSRDLVEVPNWQETVKDRTSNVTMCITIVFWILPDSLNGQGVSGGGGGVWVQMCKAFCKEQDWLYTTQNYLPLILYITHTWCHPVKCTAITGMARMLNC